MHETPSIQEAPAPVRVLTTFSPRLEGPIRPHPKTPSPSPLSRFIHQSRLCSNPPRAETKKLRKPPSAEVARILTWPSILHPRPTIGNAGSSSGSSYSTSPPSGFSIAMDALAAPRSASCAPNSPNPTVRSLAKARPPPLLLRTVDHGKPHARSESLDNTRSEFYGDTHLAPPRVSGPSEKEQTRRRMIKLQCTLGEPIAPQVVRRPKSSPPAPRFPGNKNKFLVKSQRPTLNCTKGKPNSVLTRRCAAHKPIDSFPSKPYVMAMQQKKEVQRKRRSSDPTPSSHLHRDFLPELAPLSPITLSGFRDVRYSSGSVKQDLPRQPFQSLVNDNTVSNLDPELPPAEAGEGYRPSQQSRGPFIGKFYEDFSQQSLLVPESPLETGICLVPFSPGVSRNQRRHGWSGEWNQAHIKDVIVKLRELK